MSLHLKHLQRLLYRLVTAPEGVAEGLAAEREPAPGGLASVIAGDDRLSAEDHVDIYANMYFYRLLEVLREEYSGLATVLGETNFHNLITGYLVEYPPTEPSVMWAGKYLPDFLRGHPLRGEFPFAPDLAMLERATVDVFCAQDSRVLEASEMQAISPDQWARVQMSRIPATAILNAEWHVAELLRAIEEKRAWTTPEREANRILVWRRNSRVSYRETEGVEAEALAMIARPVRFAKVCEVLARDLTDAEAAPKITGTLSKWLADGILMRPAPRGARKTPKRR